MSIVLNQNPALFIILSMFVVIIILDWRLYCCCGTAAMWKKTNLLVNTGWSIHKCTFWRMKMKWIYIFQFRSWSSTFVDADDSDHNKVIHRYIYLYFFLPCRLHFKRSCRWSSHRSTAYKSKLFLKFLSIMNPRCSCLSDDRNVHIFIGVLISLIFKEKC